MLIDTSIQNACLFPTSAAGVPIVERLMNSVVVRCFHLSIVVSWRQMTMAHGGSNPNLIGSQNFWTSACWPDSRHLHAEGHQPADPLHRERCGPKPLHRGDCAHTPLQWLRCNGLGVRLGRFSNSAGRTPMVQGWSMFGGNRRCSPVTSGCPGLCWNACLLLNQSTTRQTTTDTETFYNARRDT